MSNNTTTLDDMPLPGAICLGLQRITRLLNSLSSPHLRIPIVHVAGTNGKGSVCAYVSSILQASGYVVGRFNSPHLIEPRDSIVINGESISEHDFKANLEQVEQYDKKHEINATSFEKLTATAFLAFSNAKQPRVDITVIEVGMGGREDATNVCTSGMTLVSGITPIALDHQAFLGNTIEDIAAAKAGIIKPKVPVVCSPQPSASVENVVQQTGLQLGCDVYFVSEPSWHHQSQPIQLPSEPRRVQGQPLMRPSTTAVSATLPLQGQFQASNAAQAVLMAQVIAQHPHPTTLIPSLTYNITQQSIVKGLESTIWLGRLQSLAFPIGDRQVNILVDGAHNPSASAALGDYLASLHCDQFTLIVAVSAPRDVEALMIPMFTRLQPTTPSSPKLIKIVSTKFSSVTDMPWVHPIDPQDLQKTLGNVKGFNINLLGSTDDIISAVTLAAENMTDGKEQIVVCGSLYLVADIFRYIRSSG